MSASETLRIGIIGLGVGERHLTAYAEHPACRVVALCDFSADKRRTARERYPDLRIVEDARDLLLAPDVDLVSIASYDDAHFAQLVMAIETGKHAFVEKPLCMTRDELKQVRRLLARHPEVRVSSNLTLRSEPRFVELKRRIERGELGRLYHFEADYLYGRLHKITHGWRGELDFYSVVLGGGIHVVDLLRWLSGDEVEEVAAFGTGICTSGSSFRYHDMVVAILRFASGMVGKVSANFGSVYPHFHKLAVYGTDATFEHHLEGARLYRSRDPGAEPDVLDAPYPGHQRSRLIYSFVDSLTTGGSPIVTEEDMFKTMSVCLAIEKAATRGTRVAVDDD